MNTWCFLFCFCFCFSQSPRKTHRRSRSAGPPPEWTLSRCRAAAGRCRFGPPRTPGPVLRTNTARHRRAAGDASSRMYSPFSPSPSRQSRIFLLRGNEAGVLLYMSIYINIDIYCYACWLCQEELWSASKLFTDARTRGERERHQWRTSPVRFCGRRAATGGCKGQVHPAAPPPPPPPLILLPLPLARRCWLWDVRDKRERASRCRLVKSGQTDHDYGNPPVKMEQKGKQKSKIRYIGGVWDRRRTVRYLSLSVLTKHVNALHSL